MNDIEQKKNVIREDEHYIYTLETYIDPITNFAELIEVRWRKGNNVMFRSLIDELEQ